MTEKPDAQNPPSESWGIFSDLAAWWRWSRANPVPALLIAGIILTLIGFYVFYGPLAKGQMSFWRWGMEAWDEDNDLEHGPLILPAAILVAWLQKKRFERAPKDPSWLGLVPLLIGIFFFIVAVWTLQPRIAFVALPIIIVGIVHFLWGWQTARLALFPSGLLLFMVPIGFLLSRTEPLQRFVASAVAGITNFIGIGVMRDGVNLIALDNSFRCEVAGGCSGVRSIMAMTMLSLFYVHFSERVLWKKAVIFGMTLPFTIIGNIARVFSIVMVSKWFGQQWGTGPWHDISGFVIGLPISVIAMLKFSDLLNHDWSGVKKKLLAVDAAPSPARQDAAPAEVERAPDAPQPAANSSPISYDY